MTDIGSRKILFRTEEEQERGEDKRKEGKGKKDRIRGKWKHSFCKWVGEEGLRERRRIVKRKIKLSCMGKFSMMNVIVMYSKSVPIKLILKIDLVELPWYVRNLANSLISRLSLEIICFQDIYLLEIGL